MKVLKRDGSLEELSVDKLNAVVMAATEGLDANPSDIIMNAKLQVFDGIKTTKIHEILVKSAIDLISARKPDYQFAASRLFSFFTRKQVFGSYKPEDFPTVKELVEQNIERGFYDKTLLGKWSDEEWEKIDRMVNHDNDEKLSIASYMKLYDTYLIKDRETDYVYETPQFAFIVVSLALFDKLAEVKGHYKQMVTRKISWPTPIMAGMRTPTKQYASCTLIETKDDLDSLYASGHAIGRFVSRKAGIGTKMNFRALGDPIRGGEATHTGNIGFLKHIQNSVKAVSQGGLREGSATVTYDIFHPEIMDIIVLKNNKGTEDTRVKQLDYCIRMSKLFINRMIKGQTISLFSEYYAPELSKTFGTPEFDKLYLSYEADKSIPRKEINGKDLLGSLVLERIQTGRIYFQFADNVNGDYNAFLDPISMTNLCVEIVLPTKPFVDVNKDDGEIALCMLAGYNLEHVNPENGFAGLEETARYIIKGLDNIMDIQDYPVAHSEHQKKRRSIGIGVTNFAYWMAKRGLKYDDSKALPLVDELFEAIQFYSLKASMELAKERGKCEWFHKTKYSQGWLPIDKKNDAVRELTGNRKFNLDWEWLREEIAKWGLRNSVLTAQMPVESSSLVTNSTNGFEPPKDFVTYKKSKTMTFKFVVPGIKSLKNKYTLAWDITSNDCINKLTGIMQYWIDQAISINHYYNPLLFPDKKIPAKVVVKDMIQAYKLGNKNLYYANTMDEIQNDDLASGCDGGGCTL